MPFDRLFGCLWEWWRQIGQILFKLQIKIEPPYRCWNHNLEPSSKIHKKKILILFLNNEEIMRREKLFPKEREISPGLERRESSVETGDFSSSEQGCGTSGAWWEEAAWLQRGVCRRLALWGLHRRFLTSCGNGHEWKTKTGAWKLKWKASK